MTSQVPSALPCPTSILAGTPTTSPPTPLVGTEQYSPSSDLAGIDSSPAPAHVATQDKLSAPLAYTDVFVDDFLVVAQGTEYRLKTIRRILMHAIDEVLKAPTSSGDKFKEPLSLSKLVKDGSWNSAKVMLGWLVDAVRKTIELPDHRKERLLALFNDLKGRSRVSKKTWMSLLGELRFVSIGIPGSKGLFCILQLALTHSDKGRVKVTKAVRQHLASFERLVKDLANRPTRLAEIIPDQPRVVGAHDASGYGMGGVYFAQDQRPTVWREAFPSWVESRLVSSDNPDGDITNSDLEQAGGIAQLDVMAQHFDLREVSVGNLTDNTPTLSRAYRGATTTDGAAAYLCQYAAEHQRLHRYCNEMSFINGDQNVMADDASRLLMLSNAAFLDHMNFTYPQDLPWQLRPLDGATLTSLTLALQRKPHKMRSRKRPTSGAPTPLKIGKYSVPNVTSATPSKGINRVRSSSANNATSEGTASGPTSSKGAKTISELLPFLAHSVPLARRSPDWWTREVKTPSSSKTASAGTWRSATPSKATDEPTRLLADNGLSPSVCSTTLCPWAPLPGGQ